MSRHVAAVFLIVAFLVVAVSSPAAGQIGAGGITGLVRDQVGTAVPGATITITAIATNATRLAVSTADGIYAAPGLLPGEYRVDIRLPGFRPIRREGLRVSTGETMRLDFRLDVGGVDQAITVRGEVAPVLRAERASLGLVVEERRITDLPLNGRSFVSLAALAPGVALPPASQFPRINGGRPRTNEYLFDGISVLQPEPGQVAFPPVIDAIQEFKIESNSVPAEFGRFNGGVVNLTTKSGSNELHGAGFAFLRHEAMNARNYFAPAGAKPEYRRHQFGGLLGGPIVANRTFFFADYQGQRQTIARTVTSTVPTGLQRQGIFTEAIGGRVPQVYDPATTTPTGAGTFTRTLFAGGVVPADRMDPVAVSLLQRYPLPTSAGTVNNFTRTAGETVDQNQIDVRVDHRAPSNRDQMFVRVSTFQEDFLPVTPLAEGSGVTTGTLGPQRTRSWATASAWQHVFSDRWINDLRIGDTRRSVLRDAAQLASSASSSLNIPGIPSTAQFPNTLPTFLIGGVQQLGSPPSTASDFSTSVTEVADALTWSKSRHTVKMGLDWRWERVNVIQPASPTGAFTFTSLFTDLPGTANTGTPLASFLLGQVQSFSIDLQQQAVRNRAHFQEYFVQDDWKLNTRVTLNLGLRYTLNFPSTEVDNQAAVFNLQTRQLDYLGQDGQPRPARRLHKLDFGPRAGVVARVTDTTIVSAGYGRVFIEQAGITTPFTTPVFPFLQTVSQRTLDNITPAFVLATGPTVTPLPLTPSAGLGQGVFAVDADLGSGYVQQWNVAVQRELGANTVLEVAYVGSTITNVGLPDSNANQLTVDQLAQGSPLLVRVPNPYFGLIPRSSSLGDPTITVAQLSKPYPEFTAVSLYRNNIGTTLYQGLEVGIRHRFTRGLSYSASYTRSKLVDDASSVFDATILTGPILNAPVADNFNRGLDRDDSTGDIPHVMVASVVWDLPFGHHRAHPLHGVIGALANDWTMTALVTLQSGIPIAVTQATNFNAFAGFGVQRPMLVGDPTLPGSQRTPARWFNTDAFATTPPFAIGTASRNPVRGPSYRSVDLALMRQVPVRRATAQIRVEVFNLLNTTAFGAPNGVFGTPAFGTITTAGDPRVAQLALKLLF